MNVFEGSRRIAYLISAAAAASTLFYAATYVPYPLSIEYQVSGPGAAFERARGPCPRNAAEHTFSVLWKPGWNLSIDLCILPMWFENTQENLIPYRIDEKKIIYGAERYSNEVSEYKTNLESRFVLSSEDKQWAEKKLSELYWANWKECVKNLSIGLAVFAGFVLAVGWVVRGFLGIPRGMDRKPGEEA